MPSWFFGHILEGCWMGVESLGFNLVASVQRRANSIVKGVSYRCSCVEKPEALVQ